MTSPSSPEDRPHPGSFRDPSGFLFRRAGVLYRQVNAVYREHYDELLGEGLYKDLTSAGLMVRHEEVDVPPAEPSTSYRIIRPEPVPFISYPYEWCFGELKDAALATLRIQKMALERGLTLKDASAYNIQFLGGRPVLIDTLSFEKLRMTPWVAYRQFCQHFLAPLLLMARRDHRLGQLSRIFLDGVPLDLTSLLLPRSTRLRPGIAMHIHLHAASQKHYATRAVAVKERPVSLVSLKGLADSLERLVRRTEFRLTRTEWGNYYKETNYSDEAFEDKKRIVSEFLELAKPRTVWDLGANTGVFSRLASRRGIPTVAFDIDPVAVELDYREVVKGKETDILPLVLDLANPSPAIGWANLERDSWLARGPVDAVLALALIHHLAISNNLPFAMIARTLRGICVRLIIEFVPKSDSQVRRLLQTREDVFPGYTQKAFEEEFARHFAVEKAVPVKGSERTLYLMKARPDGA
ncbi:MAG TPA: class I SAM-dependent methyltransferase [Acidobacteriota bacterium]|nr:class I SAM-dependent methyltransferase [Acidobacteriota bacterium]